jgi:hypothetical protein
VNISISELIHRGKLTEDSVLVWNRKREGSVHRATILGVLIRTADGKLHKSPSGAAKHLNGNKPIDGWKCWRIESSNKLLDELRKV